MNEFVLLEAHETIYEGKRVTFEKGVIVYKQNVFYKLPANYTAISLEINGTAAQAFQIPTAKLAPKKVSTPQPKSVFDHEKLGEVNAKVEEIPIYDPNPEPLPHAGGLPEEALQKNKVEARLHHMQRVSLVYETIARCLSDMPLLNNIHNTTPRGNIAMGLERASYMLRNDFYTDGFADHIKVQARLKELLAFEAKLKEFWVGYKQLGDDNVQASYLGGTAHGIFSEYFERKSKTYE